MNKPPIQEIILEMLTTRKFYDFHSSVPFGCYLDDGSDEEKMLSELKELIKYATRRVEAKYTLAK